jgi:hypothetical protein
MGDAEECRAYAEHLYHEHTRLRQLLLEISRGVADVAHTPEQPVRIARLAERLANLRKQLQSHYAEDESGDCMEEAVTRCPSLPGDATVIFEEHLVLDRMLEQLVAQTRQPTPVAADIQQNWQTFATKLQAHDAAETGLLQMAFGSAVTDYDVEAIG